MVLNFNPVLLLKVLQEMGFNGILYDYDKSIILGDELEEQIDKLDK